MCARFLIRLRRLHQGGSGTVKLLYISKRIFGVIVGVEAYRQEWRKEGRRGGLKDWRRRKACSGRV